MLEVRDLDAGYYRDLHVLRGITIQARPASITAILGANGTGKSTLLKTIAGFLKPARGDILLDGRSLLTVPAQSMVRHGVAYIPQHPGIFPDMTVEENLLLGAWSFRQDRRRVARKLEENCARFPMLNPRRRQRAGELSGGQQRMVEIARTLMADPRVLLVDEPSAGLAKLVGQEVYGMLAALRDAGLTVVLVDQEIRSALKIADHVYVIDLGRNRLDGPPSTFKDLKAVFWA